MHEESTPRTAPGLPDWLIIRVGALRVVLLFLFHAVVFTLSYSLAWLVRFEFEIPTDFVVVMQASLPLVVGLQLTVGAFFGFYRGWWRYVGIADVLRLVVGLSAALVLLVVAWYLGPLLGLDPRYAKPPRGVLLVDWAFALLILFGARVAVRVGRDRVRTTGSAGPQKRVVIIGAGDAGETLAREIEHRPQLGIKVVSFVDDHRAKQGSHIRGVDVRGPIADIARIADVLRAEEALIAIPSASGKRMREIIHHLAEADLAFKTIPGIDQLVSGRVHVSQLRPVDIEDLIRREKIQLPGDRVRQLFQKKRILVTGAGGTIGSELARQVLDFEPAELHLVERSEFALYEADKRLTRECPWLTSTIRHHLADIRDGSTLDRIIHEAAPEIVLHSAAHKHVPLGELNPGEYIRNYTLATRAVAELCSRAGVERFVFISTDKAINPSSVMGASKRAAEILLLEMTPTTAMKISVVRFGNVLGSSGSVVPLFLEQIKSGGPVTVTHPDVTRYFLRKSEAISLVLQAATIAESGQILMLDMGEPIRIADLARNLIELSNQGGNEIPIVFTGLRAGEKLFEEIRLQGEDVKKTEHPQIVVTECPQPNGGRVSRWMSRTTEGTQMTDEQWLRELTMLVPEFNRSGGISEPEVGPAIFAVDSR